MSGRGGDDRRTPRHDWPHRLVQGPQLRLEAIHPQSKGGHIGPAVRAIQPHLDASERLGRGATSQRYGAAGSGRARSGV